MNCPKCKTKITTSRTEAGFVHVCARCKGRAISLPVAGEVIPSDILKELWLKAISPEVKTEIDCPECNTAMSHVAVAIHDGVVPVDACSTCHLIWFDETTFQCLPRRAPLNTYLEVSSPETKQALALAKVEELKHRYIARRPAISRPEGLREWILGFLGIPIEYENFAIRNIPLVTYLTAAAIVLVSCAALIDLNGAIRNWGLIPNQATRYLGLTFLSSFLLHGGVFHLVGNLYFLLIFGENVEDNLGRKYYLALIGFAAISGDIAHIVADPNGTIPLIGASGGIWGILTFYGLSFPKARIGVLFWFRMVRLPIWFLLLIWLVGQVFGAMAQVSEGSGISSLAHLGGAAVGLIFWWARKGGEETVSDESAVPADRMVETEWFPD